MGRRVVQTSVGAAGLQAPTTSSERCLFPLIFRDFELMAPETDEEVSGELRLLVCGSSGAPGRPALSRDSASPES